MPITITIPAKDLFDNQENRFITIKEQKITMEHSLISVSKWESKWHKPFFSRDPKTEEENIDYLRCMCITPNVDPDVFYGIDQKTAQAISDYISDPMTATTFHNKDKRPSREIITNELIYFWMANYSIPFDPCQKWHLNRLMTLIEVAALKNQPPKKMGQADIAKQYSSLNAQRKAAMKTRG